MLRRLALSGCRATAHRPGAAHMALAASARLASGNSRVPGSGGPGGDDGRKSARSSAPTRAEDEFADEDLTAVPRVPAREAAPRAVPRPGSATAWRQPMFAATTSNEAQRAAFTAGRGGPEVAEDMASIQRDVTRVSQLDASTSQARASASATVAARPAGPGAGTKAGRAPKSITAAARRGSGAAAAGAVDADELFFEGGAAATAPGFEDLEEFEDMAGDDDIADLARDLYGDARAPAVPGKPASAPARALPKAAASAATRGQAVLPAKKVAPVRPAADKDDSDLEANISDFERVSRPRRFGQKIEERPERPASGSEASGAEDDLEAMFAAAEKDEDVADAEEMQAVLEDLIEQKAAAAAAAGKPLSDVERARLRREALDVVRNPDWDVAAAGDDDEAEDLDGRISRLHFAGADAAENDPAVQQELSLMDNMLRNKRAEATAKVFGKPAALEEAEDMRAKETAVREAISAAAAEGPALSAQGLSVDYCIFCYHGVSHIRHDNMAMLTHFVSEGGAILPKRFTKCCSKHQRKLAATIRRARWLNLIPWHSRLHPKLRFASMKPEPLGAVAATPAVKGGTPGVAGAAPLGSLDRRGISAAVDEINKLAQAP